MKIKERLFWERFRPNTINPEKGKIPVILAPRIKRIVDKGIQLNMMFYGQGGTGKCLCSDTKVKLRNKITGEVIETNIDDFLTSLAKK